MAFHPIINMLILGGIFFILVRSRHILLKFILKIKIPKIILALLTAVPLIIVEEHINCGAYGCEAVIVPPTIKILLVELCIFFIIYRILRVTSIKKQIIIYAVFGMLFELFVGSAGQELIGHAIANPIVFTIIMLWVGFHYVFVVYLPLLVLNSQNTENEHGA